MRALRTYASLDVARKKGLARPMKWNDIPFNEETHPEIKALEFDLQIAENGGTPGDTTTWEIVREDELLD